MTIKNKVGELPYKYLRFAIVVLIGFTISFALGEYTSYLADAAHIAPEKSMKEVISGFGSIMFGLFTLVFSGVSLTGLGWLVYGIYDSSFITLETK